MELTKSELEIMDVMWEGGVPMSRADLLAHSEEKTWKDSSVHILLNGLLQKGAIQEAGLVKRIKTYGRVFTPTMTREEYFANTIFSHRHKPQIVGLFAALLQREEVTAEDRQTLAELSAINKSGFYRNCISAVPVFIADYYRKKQINSRFLYILQFVH